MQSFNGLNYTKIGREQTQYLSVMIVIIIHYDNNYGIICNNNILVLFTLYLLTS